MSADKPKTLTQLKGELSNLTNYYSLANHPDVQAVIDRLRKENQPRVEELERQIAKLQSERKPVLRWPENTPANVLKACQAYWNGTEEYNTFRIHLWNDKAAWTSYPSGGYSTVGGWHPVSPAYFCIDLTGRINDMGRIRPKMLKELDFGRNSGKRVTPKMMQEFLDTL